MKLTEVLAGQTFECEGLPDEEIPIDIVVAVRSVDVGTGEEVLHVTKTRATSVYTAIGMISEASMDQSMSIPMTLLDDEDGDGS